MLLKSADSKEDIEALRRLLETAPAGYRPRIEEALKKQYAGAKGKKDAAYFIDFDYEKSKNFVVIHDLRLDIRGRVAQIDHLLINRALMCFVLESKHFSSGFKITEDGEFLRWNRHARTYEGMASPLTQNERHITVLKDAFGEIPMPTRLGFKLTPSFHSYVLASKEARIDRPAKLDTHNVIKVDVLKQTLDAHIDRMGVVETIGGMAKLVDEGTLYAIGRRLCNMHQPHKTDWSRRFGLDRVTGSQELVPPGPIAAPPADIQDPGPRCKHCRASAGSILYGKYGYYLKCSACAGNTSIQVACGTPGHKERLRKEGQQFFRECAECGTSRLYFENRS